MIGIPVCHDHTDRKIRNRADRFPDMIFRKTGIDQDRLIRPCDQELTDHPVIKNVEIVHELCCVYHNSHALKQTAGTTDIRYNKMSLSPETGSSSSY